MSWGVTSQSPCKQLSVLSEKSKPFTSGSAHDLSLFQYLLNVLLNKHNLNSQELVQGSCSPKSGGKHEWQSPQAKLEEQERSGKKPKVFQILCPVPVWLPVPLPNQEGAKVLHAHLISATSVNWRGSLAYPPTTRWVKHEVFRHAVEKWKRRCKKLCLDLHQTDCPKNPLLTSIHHRGCSSVWF